MKRRKRTLQAKLRALDDHLYLLDTAFWRLATGDKAFLKSLATELRVLVCHASRTEGLLWRLMEEIPVSDEVHVHIVEGVEWDHPLTHSLHFAFVPVRRAGSGDPRLPPVRASLKDIIKEGFAALASGNEYTHEELIRALAEQMGSAHEDDGVSPDFASLVGTSFGQRSVMESVLLSDADLVLEVGARLLSHAENLTDFSRKQRAPILVSELAPATCSGAADAEYEECFGQVSTEGTLVVGFSAPPSGSGSHSPPRLTCFESEQLTLSAERPSDERLRLILDGFGNSSLIVETTFDTANPNTAVALTWTSSEISFYVNGELVESKPRESR